MLNLIFVEVLLCMLRALRDILYFLNEFSAVLAAAVEADINFPFYYVHVERRLFVASRDFVALSLRQFNLLSLKQFVVLQTIKFVIF